ncbi:MAG: phenylalanine--tRNA ligase subunit alpha, partial [Demequinaceae bacterium]|nr:phenylalanine--tRNA ligase subunit alpha [Demequinaceae bacterium]
MSDLSPLDAAGIDAAVDAATAAFDAATTLDELKEARLAHTGDKAALTLANRGIGALAGPDKATAGQLLGKARAAIGRALAARTDAL